MRRSFVTFSWISEVDWASQKATVATSWKGMFSFNECQLKKFVWTTFKIVTLTTCVIVSYPPPWVWASQQSSPCHQEEPPVAESASDHLGLDPWEWAFESGPLRMRIWDWTPEIWQWGLAMVKYECTLLYESTWTISLTTLDFYRPVQCRGVYSWCSYDFSKIIDTLVYAMTCWISL